MLEAKVERCLKNDGEFKIERFASELYNPICGYGIRLPCKYQGKGVESVERDEKTRILTFPCLYVGSGNAHKAP